jgi:hypothetical protein
VPGWWPTPRLAGAAHQAQTVLPDYALQSALLAGGVAWA